MRRKGELSRSRVDREWPHQIVLPASEGMGQNYNVIRVFLRGSLCPRGHSIMKDDQWHHVYCLRYR
jgi:hypothetical protein